MCLNDISNSEIMGSGWFLWILIACPDTVVCAKRLRQKGQLTFITAHRPLLPNRSECRRWSCLIFQQDFFGTWGTSGVS